MWEECSTEQNLKVMVSELSKSRSEIDTNRKIVRRVLNDLDKIYGRVNFMRSVAKEELERVKSPR